MPAPNAVHGSGVGDVERGLMLRRRLGWIFAAYGAIALASCGGTSPGPRDAPAASSRTKLPPPPAPAPRPNGDVNAEIARRFEYHVERHRNLDFDGLLRETRAKRAAERTLRFDPKRARYYDLVSLWAAPGPKKDTSDS